MGDYWPEAWEAFFGTKLETEKSYKLRQAAFTEAAADKWVCVAAMGDWHAKVPQGFVGVVARLGGRDLAGHVHGGEKFFLVPAEEYQTRSEFGFVVDLARHPAVPDFDGPVTKESFPMAAAIPPAQVIAGSMVITPSRNRQPADMFSAAAAPDLFDNH